MKRNDGPTYEEVVQQILAAAGGPLAVDNLVHAVLARKASASKNPRQLVMSKLREFAGQPIIFQVKATSLEGKSVFFGTYQ
jgi:hypothetical protein